jgi:hypothetical protein
MASHERKSEKERQEEAIFGKRYARLAISRLINAAFLTILMEARKAGDCSSHRHNMAKKRTGLAQV